MTALNVQRLAQLVLSDPRAAFQMLHQLQLSRSVLWQMLVVLAVLRVLVTGLLGGDYLVPFGVEPTPVSPFVFTIFTVAYAVITVFLVHFTGRALGGSGVFGGAIAMVILSEALSLFAITALLVLGVLAPPLAMTASLLVACVLFLYTIILVDENHGFGSLWKAFGTLVLGVVGLAFGLTFLVVLIGLGGEISGLTGG